MPFFKKFNNRSREAQIDAYLTSIVDNLNNILNTKKEYGSILNDLGIRDLNEFRSQEDIAAIVAQLQKRSAVFDIMSNPTNINVDVRKV